MNKKDIEDISLILRNYFNIEQDNIWNNHHGLFDEGKDLEKMAARVLGRQMKPMLGASEELKARLNSVCL